MPFPCKQVRRASYSSRPIWCLCPPVLAAIFVPQRNEMWYDLGGSLGFLSATITSLYYPTLKAKFWEGAHVPFLPLSSFAPRQLLLTAVLGIWTIRLGGFLVQASSLCPAVQCEFDNRRTSSQSVPSRPEGTHVSTRSSTGLERSRRFGWPRVCCRSHSFLRVSHIPAALWVLLVGMPVYLVCLTPLACSWH